MVKEKGAEGVQEQYDAISLFVLESRRNIYQLAVDILEKDPAMDEVQARLFFRLSFLQRRSGALGLSKLEAIAQRGKQMLGRINTSKLYADPDVRRALLTRVLLVLVDAVRQVLNNLDVSQQEGNADYAAAWMAALECLWREETHSEEPFGELRRRA